MSHNVERVPQDFSRIRDLLLLSHSHILVVGGPGSPKRAKPSLLEYGLRDDSSTTDRPSTCRPSVSACDHPCSLRSPGGRV
jgi:hypothetical protein